MCVSPINTKPPGKDNYIQVPCGKCVECISKYQNSWRFRCSVEAQEWKYLYFLTLTYSDEYCPTKVLQLNSPNKSRDVWAVHHVDERPYLPSSKLSRIRRHRVVGTSGPLQLLAGEAPEVSMLNPLEDSALVAEDRYLFIYKFLDELPRTPALMRLLHSGTPLSYYCNKDKLEDGILVPTLCRRHIQLWLKCIRTHYERSLGCRLNFKYFLCGEYGLKTLRPHYHILIFTELEFAIFKETFVDSWRYGNVEWSEEPVQGVDGAKFVAKYVSKYATKPTFVENPYVVCGVIDPPFRLCSKGIGKHYIDTLKREISPLYRNCFGDGPPEYLGFTEDFLESFYQKLHFYEVNPEDGKVYAYDMPRYWKDEVFPQKLTFSYRHFYNLNFKGYASSKVVKVPRWTKDADSFLALAFKSYVQRKNDDRVLEYLEQAREQLPQGIDLEVHHLAEALRLQADATRLSMAYQKMWNYYTKNLYNNTGQ